jgi:hypothetical protein
LLYYSMSCAGVFLLIASDGKQQRAEEGRGMSTCLDLPAWRIERRLISEEACAACCAALPLVLCDIVADFVGPRFALAMDQLWLNSPLLVFPTSHQRTLRKVSKVINGLTEGQRHARRACHDDMAMCGVLADALRCDRATDEDVLLDIAYRFMVAAWEPCRRA